MSQNRILKLFGISKGTSYYKKKGYPKTRASSAKTDDAALTAIKEVCVKRPTYGCPRIWAIAKRDFGLNLSRYKVYRYLRENGLLIRKGGARRPAREHTGKVAVPKSNTRWASDITLIKLWDGTRLRFSYILDCCDRSVIAYRLGVHMWAVDIEQMMQESLLTRFGQLRAPNRLEFLHDNGPEYLEKVLLKQLKTWNVTDCRTPTYSPQSNGICEAFNGTIKRDYIYQSCLENEQEVREMIRAAIVDYNAYAPHSALGMKSPGDFFNLKAAA